MILRTALLLPALITTLQASTMQTPDTVDPSPLPPGGLAVEAVPQFVVLTFDDNPDPDPLRWILQVARDRRNPDGSAIPLTFFSNGMYLARSPELAELHLAAYREGHEIANHTQNHPNGRAFSVAEWKAEMVACAAEFARAGIPAEAIRGFRTPFIDYNAAVFTALSELDGILYDSTIVEGFQENMEPTAFYWPYTLHNGSPGNRTAVEMENRERVGSHPGLWEVPVHVLLIPADDACGAYGAEAGLRERVRVKVLANEGWDWNSQSGRITGFDWNLLAAGLSGEDFLAILKYSLDQHLQGNRSPFIFGGHTALYPASMPGRREALEAFIDYALQHPEVRFTTPTGLIEWMRYPERL